MGIRISQSVRGKQQSSDLPVELSLKVEVQLEHSSVERASEATAVDVVIRSVVYGATSRCDLPLVTVFPLLVDNPERDILVRRSRGENQKTSVRV
jgi:hypothetical protein